MINPQPGASIYEQLAERLRQRIASGELRPGKVIPSERFIAQEFAVDRGTAGRAIRLLRAEGLLEYRRGQGMFVREQPERADLTPAAGSTVIARMPTPQERADLGVADGVPVIEVVAPDGQVRLHAADQVRLRWP